jgi:acetate kinase
MLRALAPEGGGAPAVDAVGHRVVHGGDRFSAPVVVGDAEAEAIRALEPLAELHNPVNLLGIERLRAALPDVPQVAVFDTAFHQSLPEHAWRYALPADLADAHGIRRYGFHGTSHAFVARRAAEHLGLAPGALNAVTLHLGNGASAAAIQGGRSVDTSMGMTPLEGLVMGTRSGDLDPAIVPFLMRRTGRGAAEVERLLNHDSGLLGLCGERDMRAVRRRAAAGDPRAATALAVTAYRLRKYIGAYLAVLGRVHALVFTGGIGEHDPESRAEACAGLEHLGIALDPARNAAAGGDEPVADVARPESAVGILVIPTDEELEIARQTRALVGRSSASSR